MRQLPPLLLGLVSIVACARQSAPTHAANASPQLAANRNASDTILKTTDGVTVRPADSKLVGLYSVGGDVLTPIATKAPEATLSDEAIKFIKEQHIQKLKAISLVGVTVDAHGMPQNACLVREAGHGMDRSALMVAAEYRFKPATLNGKPVPVRVTIAVRFANFPSGPSFGGG